MTPHAAKPTPLPLSAPQLVRHTPQIWTQPDMDALSPDRGPADSLTATGDQGDTPLHLEIVRHGLSSILHRDTDTGVGHLLYRRPVHPVVTGVGQALDEHELGRNLEPRQPRVTPFGQLFGVERRSPFRHHIRPADLITPGIGDTHDHTLGHTTEGANTTLDLLDGHILTTGLEHGLDAADHGEVAIFVYDAEIPGVQPTLVVQRDGRLLRHIPVPAHHPSAKGDLTDLAGPEHFSGDRVRDFPLETIE